MTASTLVNPKKYAALLVRALPTAIETEKEHKRALNVVESLMDKGETLSPEEDALLKLLVRLIQSFEDDRYPAGDTSTPASILQTLMEQRSLTHKDVWRLFGSKGVASEVLNGKRAISKTHAKALAEFFHVDAGLFL